MLIKKRQNQKKKKDNKKKKDSLRLSQEHGARVDIDSINSHLEELEIISLTFENG